MRILMNDMPDQLIPATTPVPAESEAAARGLRDALSRGAATLARAGVGTADVDAELLLAHALETSRGGLQAAVVRGVTLNETDASTYESLIARRAAREPLQHIVGTAPFRMLELAVGPGVFVPRPETEILAQHAIDALLAASTPEPRAVDLGTGSGALALALASEVPHARVWGVENSVDAFVWARENRERVGAQNARIVFHDIAGALPELDGTVDVIVSNPPYVPDGAIPRDPEVRLFDPEQALYGGPDGLDVVRVISREARRLLHPGGFIAIEHGEWQGPAVREILTADGWRAAATHPDLTMRDRVTTAIRT